MAIASPQPEPPSETTSLLAEHDEHPVQRKSATRRAHRVLLYACLIAVTLDFGNYLSVAPQLQAFESIICQRLHPELFAYTPGGGLPLVASPSCKSADVQGDLALLKGWMNTFDQLPGIILALPYGLMADRIGRKPVLAMSLLGIVMEEIAIRLICWYHTTIPPQAIWFAPLFQIIGGGSQITNSVAWTIIADVFPVEKRSVAYFILSGAILLSEIVAIPLSAWIMSSSVWIPWMLGLACEIGGALIVLLLPETKPKSAENPVSDVESETADRPEGSSAFAWSSIVRFARSQITELKDFVCEHPSSLVVFLAFFMSSYGIVAVPFMLQYVSRRFSWSLAEASLLISVKGVLNCLALVFILPMVSKLLGRYFTPVKRDHRIVLGSACILVAGFGFMSLASHPALFAVGVALIALGWGYYAALRSVSSALVGQSHIGLLNTTMALAQSVGLMVSGPLLAGLFRAGLAWEGIWMGLPWMFGVVLYVAAGLAYHL
ncbi:MFS transporter [Aspergillus sclerotioniger CBS 115572]|uniref:MFS transporter n=1 Tax=Aspergillus sclerotioniger CBS 115572 TaxID=1450535 RepID=A0A317WDI6_9EURO|nr:MFS transporter [Aspergillus sclerotioniger CBS 115572]PWY83292.1 MFS transporter [Aspergillus sclerotioniger CBS 115572]